MFFGEVKGTERIKISLNLKSTNKAKNHRNEMKKNHSAEECETWRDGGEKEREVEEKRKIRMKNTKKMKFICDDDWRFKEMRAKEKPIFRGGRRGQALCKNFYVIIFIIFLSVEKNVWRCLFTSFSLSSKLKQISVISVQRSRWCWCSMDTEWITFVHLSTSIIFCRLHARNIFSSSSLALHNNSLWRN